MDITFVNWLFGYMKKYPFKSLPKFKQKGSDIELNVPKKEYNKAVEFLMKNKLNPRG
ncbi:MAG: hypothetical protein ACPHQO_03275 [Candidatus Kariarchaeum pelagius]